MSVGKCFRIVIRDHVKSQRWEEGHDLHSKRRTTKLRCQHQQQEGEMNKSPQWQKSALFLLGAIIYEVFAGMPPGMGQSLMENSGDFLAHEAACNDNGATLPLSSENRDCDGAPRKKKTSRPHITANGGFTNGISPMAYLPLTDFGLPSSIATTVSCLLDQASVAPAGMPVYKEITELISDLLVLCNDPDRFLFDLSSDPTEALLLSSCLPDLPPPGRLYGREAHLRDLKGAFHSFVEGISDKGPVAGRAVLISGLSGTGKSSLAGQLRQPIAALGGFFLTGKFDQAQTGRPLSTICATFAEFCDLLVQRSPSDLDEVQRAIYDAVGSDSELLANLIPQLSEMFQGAPLDKSSASEVKVEGKQAWNRLKFFFRKLARSIPSPSRPVLFFLDDLHWADSESLDLVKFLTADSENSCLLLVGCYRDNEVAPDSPLSCWLKDVGRAGVNLTQIHLDNVGRDDINALVSDALRLPPRPVRSLSDAVYRKTQGNLFFAVQFILSLYEEGLLSFSLISRRWEWDAVAIESKDMDTNALGLMMGKMLKLSAEELRALQVASCFGHECEESALRIMERGAAAGSELKNVVESLNIAVNNGFMVKLGSLYRFSHDQIQKAAYSLITQAERDALHLNIGRAISRGASEAEMEGLIFVLVDQLDRGQDMVTDDKERIEIARLNLKAGKKAIASSAFLPASLFLQEGIRALRTDDWECNYDICLEMYSSCAEALFALGNYASLHTILDIIFACGRSLHDKCRAYHTLVNALHAQGKDKDAVATSLGVLAQLGVSFPAEISQSIVDDTLIETKDMLEGTTMDLIKNKNVMQDNDKIVAMQFLNTIQLFLFWGNQDIGYLVTFRMVQLSLEYGVCKESSLGFASFATALCGMRDVENGKRFARLAIHLLERFKAKEYLSRVYCTVYGFVADFYEPLQAGRVSHLSAYEVGMSCGDVMWAMMNAVQYISKSIQSGHKLHELVGEMKAYAQQMKEYGLQGPLTQTRLRLQFILNLIQSSGDPTELTGDAMNQEEFIDAAVEGQKLTILKMMYMMRLCLAYLFGKYELAIEMFERSLESTEAQVNNRVKSAFRISFESFYSSLVAIAVLDEKNSACRWKRIAKEGIFEMKAWAEICPWNFQHKYELLVAEMAFREGDIEIAAVTFDKAIRNAASHRFVHEQALACERAAIFSKGIGNFSTASDYYRQAYELYMEWGARQKAQDVMEKLVGIE